MTVSRVDPEAKSTHAAAEGYRALAVGDTDLARQKYTEAGDILDRASRKSLPASDKHLLRFLAASQYYQAGEYKRASRLAARVNPGHLPARHRPKLEQFRKTLQARTADDYAIRTRLAAFTHWQHGRTREALKVFQDHPYVVERSALAFLRADLCYAERNWRAAALFNADAIRFSDSAPNVLFTCAAGAFALHADGQHDDAWEYTEHLLKSAPTALNLVTACAIRYSRLLAGNRTAGDELIALFDRAKQEFQHLPDTTKANKDVHDFMTFGYLVAAAAVDHLGDRARAIQICEEAIAFDPNGTSTADFKKILEAPGTGEDALRMRIAETKEARRKQQAQMKHSLETGKLQQAA